MTTIISLAKDLFGLTSAAAKTTSTLGNIFKVVKPVIAVGSEVAEELFVDPWIEAYVSNMVAKAGGDAYEQIYWSTLAESGRESGFSMVTTSIQSLVAPSQVHVSGNLESTYQNTLIDLHQLGIEMKTQQESMIGEVAETAISSILLFLGALGGGVFGSAGAALGNILIVGGTSVEAITSIKDVFKKALLRYHYKNNFYSIPYGEVFHSEVSDPVMQTINEEIDESVQDAIRYVTLSEKPAPTQKAVETVDRTTRSDSSKIIDWISRRKKGLAVAGYAVVGIVGAIFPAVGAILSAIPTLTVGLVDSKKVSFKTTRPLIDTKRLDAIVSSWDELVYFIKDCLNDNKEVMQIPNPGGRAFGKISKYLFGSLSYLSGAREKSISYKTRGFRDRKNRFISREKVYEIYMVLKSKQSVFGKPWSTVHEKFSKFWSIRFNGELFQDYIQEFNLKETLYDGLKSIFAESLGISKVQISAAFISRLLESSRVRPSTPDLSIHDETTYIRKSTIARLICEVRLLSEEEIVESGKKAKSGPLAKLELSHIKDLSKLRLELEEYLLEFFFSSTQRLISPEQYPKVLFDLEVFYAIYKNIPIKDRFDVSFKNIRREMSSLTIEVDGENFATTFGTYRALGYRWESMLSFNAYLRWKVHKGQVSRDAYEGVLRAGRLFCQDMDINPAKPTGAYWISVQTDYSQSNIDTLKIGGQDVLNKFFNYLAKVKVQGRRGGYLGSFFRGLVYSSKSVSVSDFGRNPYSLNLGFTKKSRQDYIDEFCESIRRDIHDDSLEQLVRFAQYRSDDDFVSSDTNLLKLIDPSSNLDNQPSHQFIQHLALKHIPSIIAVEPAVWSKIGSIMYSGHVDFVQIIGEKIRIIDYKPNLNFEPYAINVGEHFVDSMPQVAVYAIMFLRMYGILPSDYKIECVTFNQDGYYVYDPYEALESSVDFYYGKLHELPAWSVFLSQDTIDEIVARYPPA